MLLQHFLEESSRKYPQKIALIQRGERWTYEEIEQKANQVANLLRDQGTQRGDRVAIYLDNSVESVVSLFGILKADAVFLMLSPTLKSQKLAYILNDCQVKALITHTNKAGVVSEALDRADSVNQVVWVGPKEKTPSNKASKFINYSWAEVFNSDEWSSPLPPSRLTPNGINCSMPSAVSSPCALRLTPCGSSAPYALPPTPYKNIDIDLATIIYTSGSTGTPKGVMLTHLNMISAATSITTYLENVPEDIVINVLPLSFDYGLYQVLMAFKFGGTVVLEKSFTYPYEIIKQMVKERVTGFPGVPTIFAILLQMDDLKKYYLSSLRYITNTAAALPVPFINKLREIFPQTRLYSMYGLTECKRVSYLPPEELDRRPGSVGRGMPNEEVWVVDEQGRRLGPGVVGELVVRGSNVMRGYWGDAETTDRVLKPGVLPGEKVLYTGDLFKMDEEGFLYFVARKDDMIKTRGERVSPKEVENVIHEIEGIAEVAVIPVPDDILGQAIKAYIIPKNGYVISEKDLFLHCKKNLEEFAIPKYFESRTSFPKTSSGKIDKLTLKKESASRESASRKGYE
ncbi:MAG: AMP-binding protein [Thermodesulfobacteriota bacterium]|nr:AMP-binding protein [Thermodesulfobacteriota bacterium]